MTSYGPNFIHETFVKLLFEGLSSVLKKTTENNPSKNENCKMFVFLSSFKIGKQILIMRTQTLYFKERNLYRDFQKVGIFVISEENKHDSILELIRNVAHSKKFHLSELTSYSFSPIKKLV